MTIDLNVKSFWAAEFSEHMTVAEETGKTLGPAFHELLQACLDAIRDGNKIIFFGNGGSAADAQHLATELTVRYKKNRGAIAALALTTDTSALTAIGNDFGFDYLFSRQIEALGKAGDVVIGISTSGKSKNVLNALTQARSMGMTTVGFTGGTGGQMADVCDIILNVPSQTTARIQEMHITLGQMLCGSLEIALGYVENDQTKVA